MVAAYQDPTLAIFFKKPELMPVDLRSYLIKELVYGRSVLKCIIYDNLLEYERRSQLLIPQSGLTLAA